MTLPAAIYLFFGFTATGKSTLAHYWADRHSLAHYNTDVIRKKLAGLPPAARRLEAVNHGIYAEEYSRRTYDALLEQAEEEIRAGRGVVLDGSYQKRKERQRLRQLAGRYSLPVYFVFCSCPEPVLRDRLALRGRDPAAVSDGRWEIYLQQLEKFEPPVELEEHELIALDTSAPVEQLACRLEGIISQRAAKYGSPAK
jgi:uncharacterized protein